MVPHQERQAELGEAPAHHIVAGCYAEGDRLGRCREVARDAHVDKNPVSKAGVICRVEPTTSPLVDLVRTRSWEIEILLCVENEKEELASIVARPDPVLDTLTSHEAPGITVILMLEEESMEPMKSYVMDLAKESVRRVPWRLDRQIDGGIYRRFA